MTTAPLAAGASEASGAAALRNAHAAVRPKLEQSPFGRPLHLTSTETSSAVRGDVHAVIEHPFEKVRAALDNPRAWCDILILQPNIKQCRAEAPQAGGESLIVVHLGRAEVPVDFRFRVATAAPDYLDVRLGAETGPFGTTDYRISVQATPLDARRTIVQFAYGHGYGTRARLALQTYFGTLGRGKVGFTVVDRTAGGEPVYVADLRGGLERNAMRYYFAIEAYLDALSAPPGEQVERRLRGWLARTEQYPRQLREEDGYLEQKRREAQRQQVAAGASAAISR